MAFNSSNLCQFDRFRLDLKRKVLWDDDELVHIPPKAVELLCELIERRGQVVTKDELLSRVWPDAFVEEGVLTQNIHHLRKTFKDLDLKTDPIQTVPRRGYRFAGEIRDVEDDMLFEHEIVERNYLAEISADSLKDLDVGQPEATAPRGRRFSIALVALVAAIVAVPAFFIWRAMAPVTAESSTVKGITSIAVLPFKNLNADGADRTFALGLTDSLIARLGRLSSLSVRPFSAVDKYEASGKDAVTFARELNADSVVEGTIQKADDRLRVSLRLLDVRDGAQIWSDTFDESGSDLLKLQDVISSRVARALFSRLHPRDEELLARSPTGNAEAYQLYMAGREAWLRRDWRADSISFYKKAIELDPNFAAAYLGIADQYAFTYETAVAEDALAKALELDPELHEAHATRGFLQMFHHWDWNGAETSFKRAIDLAPNSSKAHHWYGVYLSIRGRLDEAKLEMAKALELDPTALVIMTDIAEVDYFNRDYELAERELENVLKIDPDFMNARLNLVKVRYKRGRSFFAEDIAFNIFRHKKLLSDGLWSQIDPRKAQELIDSGDEELLRKKHLERILASLGGPPEAYLSLSQYYAITGDKEKSLDALERSIDSKTFVLPFVAVDPIWDLVRDDPRFAQTIRRMNL